MSGLRALAAFTLVAALSLAPRAAEACAVCFSGREGSRVAFIVTTAILTVLPLALIGGFVFWLRRRAREQSSAAPPAPSSSLS